MSPKRRPLTPAAEYGAIWWPRLEQHMWIEKWNFLYFLHETQLDISGLLKNPEVPPQPYKDASRAVRRMFMDVLDHTLDELADLGAVHLRHPDVHIRGKSPRTPDTPDDFTELECQVEFHLVVRH